MAEAVAATAIGTCILSEQPHVVVDLLSVVYSRMIGEYIHTLENYWKMVIEQVHTEKSTVFLPYSFIPVQATSMHLVYSHTCISTMLIQLLFFKI